MIKKTVFAIAIALCGCFASQAVAQETEQLKQTEEIPNPYKKRQEKIKASLSSDANATQSINAQQLNTELKTMKLKRDCQRQCGEPCGQSACASPCDNPCGKKCVSKKGCGKERKFCDRGRHHGHFGKKECGRFNPFDGIELTDAQKDKGKKAREARKEKCGKIREKMEKERAKADEGYMKELQKVLTPEQMAKFRANREAMKKKFDAKPGKKGCTRAGRMKECAGPQLNCKGQQ